MTHGRTTEPDMLPATGGGDGLHGAHAALGINEKPVHATKANGVRDDDALNDQHAPEKMQTAPSFVGTTFFGGARAGSGVSGFGQGGRAGGRRS